MLNFVLIGMVLLVGIVASMYKMFTLEVQLRESDELVPDLQIKESIVQ